MTCQGINKAHTKERRPNQVQLAELYATSEFHIITRDTIEMEIVSWTVILQLTVFLLPNISLLSNGCNQAICGSIVSKCLLTESCKCDLKTCSCCKECFFCLSYLYDECCSCLDLCPKPNATARNPLSSKSHVEDLNEPVPGLFQALTMDSDPQERWKSFTFPVDFDVSSYKAKIDIKYHLNSADERNSVSGLAQANTVTLNCTVAFIAQCSSWNKCQASCQSMGATSYRWFHDGCCECVGDTCINYGINESRCKLCPFNSKDNLDKEEDALDEYDDYGQEDDDDGDAADFVEDYILD
ncbi:twisted gastrulation protein homolog 1-B [Athalia rosae]|uniref:twisted gastrulation protein homolog 1-B n=1 Tax=Athalia rosae TaxID=37344 RepID=UPI00203378D8|nr:twisted gastrulation protein homolog 1-B [Athalia rosae]